MRKKNRIVLVIILFLLFFPIKVFGLEEDNIRLYLFYGDGCPHCAEEEKYLESIEDKYDYLEIVKLEVWYDDSNASFLDEVLKSFDKNYRGVPVNIIGNTIISGYGQNTGQKIERAIKFYHENKYIDQVERIKNGTFNKDELVDDDFNKDEEKTDDELTFDFLWFKNINLKNVSLMTSSVIIGLIDGFNPCAMWILLFLISVLIGMKDRKRMWIIGLSFLLTSAFVYMLIMLSWIQIAVKVTTVIWIRDIIALVALIGGVINLRSFIKSNDSGCEVVDDKKRKTIFKKIREFTSEKSLLLAVFGACLLAVSVNLVELACSAGLPLVFSELLVLNQATPIMKFMYTLLYIIFFLIDDMIVFIIAMISMKVTGISTKYNKYSHLLGGIIMVLVGILLLFKPEWLMFQFK